MHLVDGHLNWMDTRGMQAVTVRGLLSADATMHLDEAHRCVDCSAAVHVSDSAPTRS